MAFDTNKYFHIGKPERPLILRAAQPKKEQMIQTGQLGRSGPTANTWMNKIFSGQSYNSGELKLRHIKELLRHPTVKSALRMVQLSLLSKEHHIIPAGKDQKSKEMADFIIKSFDGMNTPMRQVRKDLYAGIHYGYAVSEIIFKLESEMITLAAIKNLPRETLENCFKYDDYGDLEEVVQTNTGGKSKIPIPVDKCLIYSFDEESGDKYGSTILSTIYDTAFAQKKALKWLLLFVQKHGAPALAGKVGQDGDADGLLKVMGGIREGRTAGVMGPNDELDLLESQKDGEAFFKLIRYLDSVIYRAFLIGTLVLGQDESSGSYAQSQTHFDVFKLFLDGVHADLTIIFNNLVRRLIDLNYPGVTEYPTFKFDPFVEKDIIALLKALQPYADKFYIDKEAVTQLIVQLLEEYGITVDETEEQAQEEEVFPVVDEKGDTVNPEEMMDGVQKILDPTISPIQ